MFTTDRLVLRAYEPSDDDNILAMWNDEILRRKTRIAHVIPVGQSFASWVNGALSYVVITIAATGEFVGTCSLWLESGPKNRDAELGITIARAYWDKGYGTETLIRMRDHAFKDLALHRLSLGLFASNERARRAYQKAGFIEEARLRKALWNEDHWADTLRMSILEEEWRALKDEGRHALPSK